MYEHSPQFRRQISLDEFAGQIETASSSRRELDMLVGAYAREDCVPGTSAHDQLLEALLGADTSSVLALAAIAADGDPVEWPGLTDPAVDALGRYLVTAGLNLHNEDGTLTLPVGDVVNCAELVLSVCFSGQHDCAYYQRLIQLCNGVAVILECSPAGNRAGLAVRAARALRAAPTEAVLGPLRSWVRAFRVRYEDGNLRESERRELAAAAKGGARKAAFAELVNIL
jgi:hypothetical protein